MQVSGREEHPEESPGLRCPSWHPELGLAVASLVAPSLGFAVWLDSEPRWRMNRNAWQRAKEGELALHRTQRQASGCGTQRSYRIKAFVH